MLPAISSIHNLSNKSFFLTTELSRQKANRTVITREAKDAACFLQTSGEPQSRASSASLTAAVMQRMRVVLPWHHPGVLPRVCAV